MNEYLHTETQKITKQKKTYSNMLCSNPEFRKGMCWNESLTPPPNFLYPTTYSEERKIKPHYPIIPTKPFFTKHNQ